MSILVDVNQIAIGVLINHLQYSTDFTVDMNLIRHSVISKFLDIETKFSKTYGKIILCYDSNHYWRKDYFVNYKASRKKDREQSTIDWNKLFDLSNTLRDEFTKYLPYVVLCIDNAEADDIIAVLCKQNADKHLIVSGDKDFKQLQVTNNISIYNSQLQKIIYTTPEEAQLYLKEHIIRGDRSDGIPNILSPDNCFVDKIRQKPVTKKRIDKWIIQNKLEICAESSDILYNYNRNEILIDFKFIPDNIINSIMCSYNNYVNIFDKSKLFKYFAECNLTELTRRYSQIFILYAKTTSKSGSHVASRNIS